MQNQLLVRFNQSFVFAPDKVETNLANKISVNKPQAAFWTSSAVEYGSYVSSDWLEYISGEKDFDGIPYETVSYLFVPKKDVKVYEINDLEDYMSDELCKLGGSFADIEALFVETSATGFDYDHRRQLEKAVCIDYQAMQAKGYDAIHFSEETVKYGHWGYGGIQQGTLEHCFAEALFHMDVESTVWLTSNWYASVSEVSRRGECDMVLGILDRYQEFSWQQRQEEYEESLPWYERIDLPCGLVR